MYHSPSEIAIIERNTLTALGLRTIIEEMFPQAVVRTFDTFERFMDDTPDMYVHYFVSSQVYFEHTSFFLERRGKCIVLCGGDTALSAVPTLNIHHTQDELVQDIMRLQQHGHRHVSSPSAMMMEDGRDLSPREIQVLVLITKGMLNKEIADKLHISLTTVISHRKNIVEKLGIKSASGLAIYAVMHGYIEADRI